MFDFEKLLTYQKAKIFNRKVQNFLVNSTNFDRTTKDQLRRASISIMLNIAEGTGRFTKPDKSNFYVIARGSVFECVAVFDYLHDEQQIDHDLFLEFYLKAEELSKMLFTMIQQLKTVRG